MEISTSIAFTDFVLQNSKIWFSAADFNGLMEADLTRDEVKLLGVFPEEKLLERELYSSAAIYKSLLIFAPRSADQIAVYDLNKKEFIKICLPEIKRIYRKDFKFTLVTVYEHNAFFLPMEYPAILKLDLETMKLDVAVEWHEGFKIRNDVKAGISDHSYSVRDQFIFFLFGIIQDQKSEKKIGIFDMSTERCILKDCLEKNGYSAICADTNTVCLAEYQNGSVYISEWNQDADIVRQHSSVEMQNSNEVKNIRVFWTGTSSHYMFFLLNNCFEMICWDTQEKRIEKKTFPLPVYDGHKMVGLYDGRRINFMKIFNHVMFYQDTYTNVLYALDLKSRKVEKHKFEYMINLDELYRDVLFKESRMNFYLRDYLNYVRELNTTDKTNACTNGDRIYENLVRAE